MSQILVVDDESSIRITLREFLLDEGYVAETAEDATVAMEMLQKKPYDLVLADIILPRITGVTLIKNIKKDYPDTQVVLMTGEPTIETASEAVRAGAFDYLAKPIDRVQLFKVVKNALNLKQAEDERKRLAIENLAYQEKLKQLVEKKTDDLAKSETRFKRFFEDLGDAVFVINQEEKNKGQILEVNPAAEKQSGYSAAELTSMNILDDLYVSDSTDFFQEDFRKIFDENEAATATGRVLRKDESCYWVEVVVTQIEYKDKRVCLAIHRDISERKKVETELKTLSMAIQQSPVSVMITDLNGDIEYVNPNFTDVTGYTAEEVIGQNPRILKGGAHTDIKYKELWDTIITGQTWHGEFYNKKKNGELYWEDARISAVLDNNGQISHFLAVKEDITAQKKAEEEKNDLEKQLRRSQKLETIGTLAGGIAHDFNNILTPILGYTDMAVFELSEKDPLKQNLRRVLEGAHRAKELVEQILLFSKQIEKDRKPLRLHLLIREALKLLRASIPVTIDIVQNIDPKCNKVMADATQIHQVVLNLCTNAWQAMEQSGGTLTIKLEQRVFTSESDNMPLGLEHGEYAYLSVSDSGPGIEEGILERIFEPFFTTKAVDKGTGLGLSVVHGIVKNHNGEIFVFSTPGEGTQFDIYIPTVKDEVEVALETSKNIANGEESILVVDDDIIVGNMLFQMLAKFGYKVSLYKSSEDAFDAFMADPQKYDLIISDLTMPTLTGLELAQRIHSNNKKTPILIMTGYGDKLHKIETQKYGIKRVIEKPVMMNELSEAIREILDDK